MHPSPDHKPYQPAPTVAHPNLPVHHIEDVGSGWRKPSIGETVKSYWQVYAFHTNPPKWKLTAWRTSEKLVHDGRANYRVPVSLSAWRHVIVPYLLKSLQAIVNLWT